MSQVSSSDSAVDYRREMALRQRRWSELQSLPKLASPGFVLDRRSVYWVDKLPAAYYTGHAMTEWQEQLAYMDRPRFVGYLPARPRPIWDVRVAAQRARLTNRVRELANPKLTNVNYKPDKSPFTRVTGAAKRYALTARTRELAQHKRLDRYGPIPPRPVWEFDDQQNHVSPYAKVHEMSPRQQALANPRPPFRRYVHARGPVWPVAESTMKATPTERVLKLAVPKPREELQRSDWPKLSPATQTASATPRLEELSTALERKSRKKFERSAQRERF